MFDACNKIHKAVGFGGRKVMEIEGAIFYSNMTRPIIETFLNYSKEYQIKRKRTVNHMQSLPDGEFKWILNAQDHLTKFCHLRPIRAKSAKEVAWPLYKIFFRVGALVTLQSDNGKELRNQLLIALKLLWPGLQIVHGRARRNNIFK